MQASHTCFPTYLRMCELPDSMPDMEAACEMHCTHLLQTLLSAHFGAHQLGCASASRPVEQCLSRVQPVRQ
jgi:hypothetical protein